MQSVLLTVWIVVMLFSAFSLGQSARYMMKSQGEKARTWQVIGSASVLLLTVLNLIINNVNGGN